MRQCGIPGAELPAWGQAAGTWDLTGLTLDVSKRGWLRKTPNLSATWKLLVDGDGGVGWGGRYLWASELVPSGLESLCVQGWAGAPS